MLVMAEIVDDRLLVERFNRGDETAFETIIRRHSGDVAALANRLLGWPGDVEDVTQEVFLAALRGLKRFRSECSLRTWLYTITINKCRTWRYRRMLRIRFFSKASGKTAFTSARPVDEKAGDSDTFRRVRQVVKDLPGKYRQVVVLKYLQQLPPDQIGRILGISRNALEVRLSRARGLLKQELAELIED